MVFDFLKFAMDIYEQHQRLKIKIRDILVSNFRGLWTDVGLYDELEAIVQKFIQDSDWGDGLVSVNRTITYDHDEMKEEVLNRLKVLARLLEPKDLVSITHTFVIDQRYYGGDFKFSLDDDDRISEDEKEADKHAIFLGKEVVKDIGALNKLLPDLIQKGGSYRLYHFGRGLALEADNLSEIWGLLIEAYKTKKPDGRQNMVLCGFFEESTKINLDESMVWLENAYSDQGLKDTVISFETILTPTLEGYKRLQNSLLDHDIFVRSYWSLIHYGKIETMPSRAYAEIVKGLSAKENGVNIAIEVFDLRLHGKKEPIPDYLKEVGLELLQKVDFRKEADRGRLDDYHLANLVKICLSDGVEDEELAFSICKKMNDFYRSGELFRTDFESFIKSLATKQPLAFLNGFFLNEKDEVIRNSLFSLSFSRRNNPISEVDDEIILRWCEAEFQSRAEVLIGLIKTYEPSQVEGEKFQWTALTKAILSRTEMPEPVFKRLVDAIRPRSWSGSLAPILRERISLIEALTHFERVEVADLAKQYLPKFHEYIAIEEDNDERRFRTDSESFE